MRDSAPKLPLTILGRDTVGSRTSAFGRSWGVGLIRVAEGTRSLAVWEEMGGGRGLEVVTLLPSLPCVQAYA